MLALAPEHPAPHATGGALPPGVVVVGASAGGLDALQKLLPRLRPNGVTAYVVVQHLSSDAHLDLIHQLLQRSCALPVHLMVSGQRPQPDTVCLVPAGCHAYWDHGRWSLRAPLASFVYTPSVDALLQSLASGLRERAAVVILSGAGNDGALGALELQRVGSQVWVQLPEQSGFDGMPRAVMAAVPAARVLRVEDMPAAWGWWEAADERVPWSPGVGLSVLLDRVREVSGVDFSGYKTETLERRLVQRMKELEVPDLGAYLALLDNDVREVRTLQRRWLVSVSSFFRDRAAFDALARAWRQQPPDPGRPWRCWVPACATGEEAYTLAMLFADGCRAGAWSGEIEVLGTDLNDEALDHAAQARYGARAMKEVDETTRQRHFMAVADGFEVVPAIRQKVRLQRQEILSTQPDGPWDVISCRNLLIYLQPAVQERLIADFHSRLVPGGWLIISPAETLPHASPRGFVAHDSTHRIYRRLP